MRKAVSLKVIFWIEGEDLPAHNFVETAKKAVNDIVLTGSKDHPELKISIKQIGEFRGNDKDSFSDEF
ncbi:MAG: hypothetical protein Q8933_11505 [Bacteroidota bacterium]|nr:hypothetical protein [Bacteroidota bacterium]MDP4194727.1 hypothetical protein [Bacteroidota bacterium]